ncbi:MAG: hypothetical protein ACFCVG_16275 [Kineosporiaceae bacterium]
MPRRTPVPPELSAGPFRTAEAVGLVGRSALAGPSYRRLLRGVHQAADLPVDHGTMIEAVRADGSSGVLCGPSAAWALGCRLADPDEPVHLTTGRDGTGGDSRLITRYRMDVPGRDLVDTRAGVATSPARTAVDLARGVGTLGLPFHRRVAWIDALLRATGLRAADARRAAVGAAGRHGRGESQRVLRAARDGVDSPKETELRLLVVRFGFPEPQVQCPVVDRDGTTIASLDLGWRRRMTGLEYDGSVHLEAQQHGHDLSRLNEVRSIGWHVLQVDRYGLRRPGRWLRQLAARVPRR